MAKRLFSLILLPLLCFSFLLPAAPEAHAKSARITDRDAVDGSDFTVSPSLAETLNSIFDGDAGIYADIGCTRLVETPLGSSPVKNNGIYMYVDPADGIAQSIGTSCWIYANGVYHTLFGESTGNGIGENSEKLKLNTTANRKLSYSNLKAWGVRQGVGALIRASGHSMIVLGYDEDFLTILDGNGDGRGLVSISKTPWSRLGSYVEYIVQPTQAHYANLYGCGVCGEDAVWWMEDDETLIISGSGSVDYPGWQAYNDRIREIVIQDGGLVLGSGLFYNCTNLQQIIFQGTPPELSENTFLGVTASVLYPAPLWGQDPVLSETYGGTPTWTPFGMTELTIHSQPTVCDTEDALVKEVQIGAGGDGLRYTWYVKYIGETIFLKSSCTGPVYKVNLNQPELPQQVFCVVRDQYGDFLISESVLLTHFGPDPKACVI